MSYTFLKAQGHEIGKSLCETDKLDLAKDILQQAHQQGVEIALPVDSVVAPRLDAEAPTQIVDHAHFPADQMGLDIGPETIKRYREIIQRARTILWNGPMGVFELKPFVKGTQAIAEAIVQATQAGAFSLVGGGDSVSALHQFGLEDRVSYVSTGGGALLEYFEGKTLPGIAAIQES